MTRTEGPAEVLPSVSRLGVAPSRFELPGNGQWAGIGTNPTLPRRAFRRAGRLRRGRVGGAARVRNSTRAGGPRRERGSRTTGRHRAQVAQPGWLGLIASKLYAAEGGSPAPQAPGGPRPRFLHRPQTADLETGDPRVVGERRPNVGASGRRH